MSISYAQDKSLPYYEIPDAPSEYSAETAVSRMIDGLGFRYYWASEGLREEDLTFKPSEEARTTRETINHICGLTYFFLNSIKGDVNQSKDVSEMTFKEVRTLTLNNIKEASDLLKTGTMLKDTKIRYSDGSEMPFWNNINGPIADAIWHVGQVVSFRRSSGNPYNNKASVFNGKVRK